MADTKLRALDPLNEKLVLAGIEKYELQRLIEASDPQNLSIAKSEIIRVLQEPDICEQPISFSVQIIQEILLIDNEPDPETEGLINYLIL